MFHGLLQTCIVALTNDSSSARALERGDGTIETRKAEAIPPGALDTDVAQKQKQNVLPETRRKLQCTDGEQHRDPQIYYV